MKHSRHFEAIQRWGKLAAGNPDAETLEWVAGVARKVLEANASPDPRAAMVGAVGLAGQIGEDEIAIRLLAEHLEQTIRGDGTEARAERRKQLRALVRIVCNLQDLSDEAIDARIRRSRPR